MELNPVQNLNLLTLNPEGSQASEPPFLEEKPLVCDLWSFGFFWNEIKRQFSTVESLYAALFDIQEKISHTKEIYRELSFNFDGYKVEVNKNRGISGSYLLIDQNGGCAFLAKPLDEDGGCIHNKEYASPFAMSPFRKSIPLYEGAMREVLASAIAGKMGLSVVPKTFLGIIESDQFYDFSLGILPEERGRYWEYLNPAEREKLCSVQEFIQGAKSLFEAVHDLEMAGLSDEEIAARFDTADFEEANLFLWVSYDTDGHMGNFLVYPKGSDDMGNEILGIKKIDNSLAFPEKNGSFRNNLSYLPNSKMPLSDAIKEKIAQLDAESLSQEFEKLGLQGAVQALKERIPILKELALREGITIKEISKEMANIGRKK